MVLCFLKHPDPSEMDNRGCAVFSVVTVLAREEPETMSLVAWDPDQEKKVEASGTFFFLSFCIHVAQ